MQNGKDYEVERELLDVNDLCVCLGIGKTTAYKLLNSEDFPTVRIGRRIYANRSEINKWISCRVKAEEKGIQNRQLLWYVMDVFSNWWKSGTSLPSLSSLLLPREKREREKQKRKNQRKE